jgi:hypothetical protein
MEHKPFEEDDPLELIAAGPFATEEDCLEEMARTFIDEYARLGWNRKQLLKLFRDPFYQGPHLIYQTKGEAFISQLIVERVPESRLPASLQSGCSGGPICGACPVGRSFGKTQCPIKRTAHGVIARMRARLFGRPRHA